MSIRNEIIQYLSAQQNWVAGGRLERELGTITQHKSSTISRECRDLAKAEIILKKLDHIEGVPSKVVFYKANEEKTGSKENQSRLFD